MTIFTQEQKDFLAKVDAWVAANPNKTCSGAERLALEIPLYKSFGGTKTHKQINKMVQNRLSLRDIFCPEKTGHSKTMREAGAPGTSSAAYLADHIDEFRAYQAAYYADHIDEYRAYNAAYYADHIDELRAYKAAYRAVQQAIRRTENAAKILLNPILSKRGLLSVEDAKTTAESLLLAPRPEFNNMSIFRAVQSGEYLVYVGTTKQLLHMEDLRWLTARGFNLGEGRTYNGRKNVPVLQWRDAGGKLTPVKMKYARETLGFKSILVYTSGLRTNSCAVEDAMQRAIHDFGNPYRLHRFVAMGNKFDNDDSLDPNFLVDTFVTFAKASVWGHRDAEHGEIVVVNKDR